MDIHFQNKDYHENLPVILGLIGFIGIIIFSMPKPMLSYPMTFIYQTFQIIYNS